jgi:Spy/CpxP family protein refolding chaperone
MTRLRDIALVALLVSLASGTGAQQRPAPRGQAAPGRAQLEGEVRRGFARAVRERVGLTDDQMRRLAPVTQQHEQQRRQLQIEERGARMALQLAMSDSTPDQAKVSQELQRLLDIQKRRIALLESEQKDLAAIMNPVQRARYMALQEQVRRRMEQMRLRRMMGPDVPPGRVPPP